MRGCLRARLCAALNETFTICSRPWWDAEVTTPTTRLLNVRSKAQKTWKDTIDTMIAAAPSGVEVHPPEFSAAFRASLDGDIARLEADAVVFCLPFRPGNYDPSHPLFVVVGAQLDVDISGRHWPPDTLNINRYATRVSYFELRAHRLVHMLALHFDVDAERLSHPHYHCQLDDRREDYKAIVGRYRSLVAEGTEPSVEAFKRQFIRIPTAHHDFFSVALQLFADHVLGRAPSDANADRFRSAAQSQQEWRGPHPSLCSPRPHFECVRSAGWYTGA